MGAKTTAFKDFTRVSLNNSCLMYKINYLRKNTITAKFHRMRSLHWKMHHHTIHICPRLITRGQIH